MRKKNNDHSKPCPISSCAKGVIIVLMAIVLVVSSIAAIYMSFSAKDKVKELEHQISQITTQQQADMDSPTEQTVAFLESEIQRHREFIQDQENHLIRLVAVIGTLGIFILSIVGISNRNEIRKTIAENYEHIIDEELCKVLGGKKNQLNLENVVKQERQAKQKKILFLYWCRTGLKELDKQKLLIEKKQKENSDKEQHEDKKENGNQRKIVLKPKVKKKIPKQMEEELDCMGFQVKNSKINYGYDTDKFKEIINGYDVVIYEVNESENSPGLAESYKSFCMACEESNTYGLLYTPNHLSDFYTIPNRSYTCIANMKLTLKQDIFSILYH